MFLLGKLFEVGPDGFGYIIDQSESYPVDVSQIPDLPPSVSFAALEGHVVRFHLKDGRVHDVTFVKDAASAKA